MSCNEVTKWKKEILELSKHEPYGIINNHKVSLLIHSLLNKNGNLTLEEYNEEGEVKYINICEVVNTLCYKISNKKEDLREFNPTLQIESSANSFWSVNETEYKIDACPEEQFGFSQFHDMFENSNLKGFQTGSVGCTYSFERYLELLSENKTEYLVLLGKKGWPKKPAIKFKKEEEGNILTRKVKILELNEKNLIESIEEITNEPYDRVEIHRFPPFYKKKDRVVCIDTQKGYLYGLSYSEAKIVAKEKERFNQIEIEFWSRIISDTKNAVLDWQDVDKSHKTLIEEIQNKLLHENFQYKSPGGRKYEWLLQVGKSRKSINLQEII